MTEYQTKEQSGSARAGERRCLCCEVMDRLEECFGVTPAVREHLANSRIEFLKAIRELIDQRITQLSNKGPQQGTKVPVE